MKKALKWTGIVVMGFVGLLGLAVVFVVLPPGERLVKNVLIGRIDGQIQGQVSLGNLDISLDEVVLQDLQLKSKNGEPLVKVPRISVDPSLTGIVSGRIEFESVKLREPQIHVRHTEEGWDLLTALDPRKKQKEESAGGWPISVDNFQMEDGAITVEREGTTYVAQGLDATGHLRYGGEPRDVAGALALAGSMMRPIRDPLSLRVSGNFELGGGGEARARVELGESRIVASWQSTLGEAWRAELEALEVHPHQAQALAPRYPLLVPLQASARVRSPEQGRYRVQANVEAGRASLAAQGLVDVQALRAENVWVRLRNLNLARILSGMPQTDLAMEARADLSGSSWESLRGTIALSVPKGEVQDLTVGPIQIRASADEDSYAISEAQVNMPGVRLTAGGSGPKADVSVSGQVKLLDLDRAARLASLLGVSVPPVAGHGHLNFSASGDPGSLAVSVRGRFPRLAHAGRQVQHLRLRAEVADAGAAVGHVSLRARSIRAAGARLERLYLSARRNPQGRSWAKGSVGGQRPSFFRMAGDVSLEAERIGLASLVIGYPDTVWRMRGNTFVDWSGGRIFLADTVLQAKDARLAFSVRWGDALQGEIRFRDVSRDVVPEWAPANWEDVRAGGALSGLIHVGGTPRSPDASWSLALLNGWFRNIRGISAGSEGRYHEREVLGDVVVSWQGNKASANFRLPLPTQEASANVELKGKVVAPDLAVLSRAVPSSKQVPVLEDGRLQASFAVDGTLATPRFRVQARAEDLVFAADEAIGAAERREARIPLVSFTGRHAGVRTEVTMHIESPNGGTANAEATVLGALEALRSGAAGKLKAAPVAGRVRFEELDMQMVPEALLPVQRLDGTLSGRARLSGQVGQPRVVGTLTWSDGVLVMPPPEPQSPASEVQAQRRSAPSAASASFSRKISAGSRPSDRTVR